jgi:hypothetical protein
MKAILFIRVSTEHQEFEEQTKELLNKALSDGYSKEDIITIAEKESGIKLSEEERSGIKKMKELIEEDTSINCLYIWEVSRLARTKKVLFSVQEYLLKRGIQLKVMKPEVMLLNSDGSINAGASMVFTLFAEMAEQEMILKKARFARGKARCNNLGKTNNGRVVFGYKIDKNGYIVEDEENADIVRYIFETYAHTNDSAMTIYRDLSERGMINRRNRGERTAITNILSNPAYYGGKAYRSEHKYPPIITQELFDEAALKRKNSIKKSKDNTKWFHHAHGLVSYYYNGDWYKMSIRHCRLAYYCEQAKVSVSSNVLDSVTWWFAKQYEVMRNLRSEEEEKEINIQNINILSVKIETSKKYQIELNAQKERIDDLYVTGHWEKKKYLSRINELERQIKEEERKIASFNSEIQRLKIANNKKLSVELPSMSQLKTGLFMIEDKQIIQTIIKRSIKSIQVQQNSDKHYFIRAQYMKELPITPSYFEFWVNGNVLNLKLNLNGEWHDYESIIKRFYTRKRYE